MIYLMYKSAKFRLVLTVTYLQIYIRVALGLTWGCRREMSVFHLISSFRYIYIYIYIYVYIYIYIYICIYIYI